MKLPVPALVLFALVLFSWDASAQTRRTTRREPTPTTRSVPEFGSVARNKLLRQARGNAASRDLLRLGSTARRAILTGKSVQVPRPKYRRSSRGPSW